MSNPPRLGIREVLLNTLKQKPPSPGGGPMTQTSVLHAAAKTLGIQYNRAQEEALLTAWADLFRGGILAWGISLNSPDPPHFHLTETGRRALETLTRDPSNPDGYLRHVESIAPLPPIAAAYLREGLACYVSGQFKAAAVMLGAAAECLILGLRDRAVQRLKKQRKPVPPDLLSWQIKKVSDHLAVLFDGIDRKKQRSLRDLYDAHWRAFTYQVRAMRNEAGHPASIEPVTADGVHAGFLVFPEIVRLESALSKWIAAGFR